jgi:hypothetical protein
LVHQIFPAAGPKRKMKKVQMKQKSRREGGEFSFFEPFI